MKETITMLPLHLAPGLLVMFMVTLAVVPVVIVWLDERRSRVATERLVRLRDGIALREQLARLARAEAGRRTSVSLPEA
jgi:hypothetical protein